MLQTHKRTYAAVLTGALLIWFGGTTSATAQTSRDGALLDIVETIAGGEVEALEGERPVAPGVEVGPAIGSSETVVVENDGSTSVVAIFDEPQASVSATFPLEMGPGYEVVILPHGGGVVLDVVGLEEAGISVDEATARFPDSTPEWSVVASFDAPWAVDAEGRALPTAYRVQGGNLVQDVNARGAAFPVAADPSFGLGWKGFNPVGYVHFSRGETVNYSTYSVSRLSGVAGLICEAAPPGLGWACSALVKARAKDLIEDAKYGVRTGRCLSFYTALGAESLYRWDAYTRVC